MFATTFNLSSEVWGAGDDDVGLSVGFLAEKRTIVESWSAVSAL